jgi:hypothetical protein
MSRKNFKQVKMVVSFLVLLLVINTNTKSQTPNQVAPNVSVAQSIKDNFSLSVVERVYDLLKKTNLPFSESRQTFFAKYFSRRDSVLNFFIESNFSDSIVTIERNKLDSIFENILEPEEKFRYFTSRNYGQRSRPITPSQFSKAIEYKTQLGLTQNLVNVLLQKIEILRQKRDSFYLANPNKSFDSRAYESETMSSLLTEDQYTDLLTIKNGKKSLNYALNDWKEMQARNLDSTLNKDSTIKSLTSYYLLKNNTFDRFMHDKIRQSEALRIVYEGKPQELVILIKARRSNENDTMGSSYHW